MSNYPGVTLEEAETIADMLGYDMVAEGGPHLVEPVAQSTVNAYICILLGAMFGDFEEHYEGKTWADCPPAAKVFYDKANAVEVR
jgi:hypothetical protein